MPLVSIATRHAGIDGVTVENADIQRGAVRVSGAKFPPGVAVEMEVVTRAGTKADSLRADRDGSFSVDLQMPKIVSDFYDEIPQVVWSDEGNVWAARMGDMKLILWCPAKALREESAETIKARVVERWR